MEKMTLIETLEYFIDDTKQRCGDIKWEIKNCKDETYLNDFKQEYEEHSQRLSDLEEIKSIVEILDINDD
jgi:hypothetical protein